VCTSSSVHVAKCILGRLVSPLSPRWRSITGTPDSAAQQI
jgi:hypothetical protein